MEQSLESRTNGIVEKEILSYRGKEIGCFDFKFSKTKVFI